LREAAAPGAEGSTEPQCVEPFPRRSTLLRRPFFALLRPDKQLAWSSVGGSSRTDQHSPRTDRTLVALQETTSNDVLPDACMFSVIRLHAGVFHITSETSGGPLAHQRDDPPRPKAMRTTRSDPGNRDCQASRDRFVRAQCPAGDGASPATVRMARNSTFPSKTTISPRGEAGERGGKCPVVPDLTSRRQRCRGETAARASSDSPCDQRPAAGCSISRTAHCGGELGYRRACHQESGRSMLSGHTDG
jgi:hypothetical protein